MIEKSPSSFGLNRFDWRSLDRFVADVKLSESLGYGYALNPYNPLGILDPYVWLSIAARETSRIGLGPFIDNPVLKHPAVTASSIATLQDVSAGRALLGYGVGDTAVRWLGKQPATVRELEDATSLIRRLLAGHEIDFGAERAAKMRSARQVPLWIAAGGPKTLRMAGRVADGVFLRVGRHPENLRSAVECVWAGAKEANRDPEELAIGIVIHTITSQRPAEIRAISRAMAAGFYEYSPALFDIPGLEWGGPAVHELRKRVWPDFHHAPDLVSAGAIVDFLTEDTARSFAIFGAPTDMADQLRTLLAELPRVDVVVPHPVPMPGPDSKYKLWFATEVIPKL